MVNTLPCLHIIINNAAQTVRRNPQYYAHLMETELLPVHQLPSQIQTVVESNMHFLTNTTGLMLAPSKESSAGSFGSQQESIISSPQLHHSASMSQAQLIDEDFTVSKSMFPEGSYDVHNQQIDLRTHNSWLMRMHEVPTIEMIEVTAVNAIAPFIINKGLKPLMLKIPEEDKFIINVSAMEGKFYRFKTVNHPHTNMAKASLNMMTRTSADDYAKDRIYMNAVDTGWITDENPFERAQDIAKTGFQTPIDEEEASSRILDPIFACVHDGVKEWGKFYKDYAQSEW
eukprot:TRINITY_DN4550_c0_g1_i1.p1 TRINITY_DN4550_c0_g1~~TRINITY_DN4550_c0_g1_i1.p1  ORF type:complete len:286 (+),score=82.78 TRINITY_DN4550_c0_g1_i1:726-1583(+)